MRVARILTRLNLGGPARQVLASDPLLQARGHTVSIFAGAEQPGEGSLVSELRAAGLDVTAVPGLSRGFGATLTGRDRTACRFLERALASFGPDVVHTHASKAGAVGRRAARRSVPSAALVHTFHGHVLEGYFPAPISLALRRVERRLARTTDRILAVSEATRDDLVRLGVAGADAIEVVPPGVRLDELLALPVERPDAQLRRELGLDPQDPLIGVVGRLAPVKRPELALEVFSQIAIEFRTARLAFVGDGSERRALEVALGRLRPGVRSRVHLLGARNDVTDVHAALDVLLSTSASEGMPVAMIEAGAAARPVVATAVGGVPELVRSGVTGLFGTDRDGLAAALGGLCAERERRLELGRAARVRVSATHTPQALASKLEAVYAGVVASRA